MTINHGFHVRYDRICNIVELSDIHDPFHITRMNKMNLHKLIKDLQLVELNMK